MKRLTVMAVGVLMILATGMAQAGEINLSAAASLKEALEEIIAGFGKEHPDAKILTNYGASGTLAKQVGQGAPADIFISANQKWLSFFTISRHGFSEPHIFSSKTSNGRKPIRR